MPRRLALLLAAAIALGACDFERALDVELPGHDPRLVVGAALTPDSAVAVRFARSAAARAPDGAGTSPLEVAGVRAALFDEDGRFLDSLRETASPPHELAARYVSAVRPMPGRRYTLRASAPGLPEVSAVAAVPAAVPVAARWTTPDATGAPRVVVTWTDPPGAHTYHLTLMEQFYTGGALPADFTSADPLLRDSYATLDRDGAPFPADTEPPPGIRYFWQGALARDRAFSERTVEVTLTLWTEGVDFSTSAFRVVLSALADDLVRYRQTAEAQRLSIGNPFVEPPAVFSNVAGGLGVFSAYASAGADLGRVPGY